MNRSFENIVALVTGAASGKGLATTQAFANALCVRAYNGQNSSWYKAALRQKTGWITAAGMTKEVSFEPVNGPIK